MDKELEFRKIGIEYLEDIYVLQEKVEARITRKEMFVPWKKSEYQEALNGKSDNYGIFYKDVLIAYNMIYYPWEIDYTKNLGSDVGLDEKYNKMVGHFEYIFVDPDFAGKGVGKLFSNEIRKGEYFSKDIKYLAATVHPDNIGSLKILLGSGMQILDYKLKYGNKKRYILFGAIGKTPDSIDSARILLDDLEKQSSYFENGYIGTKVIQEGGNYYIILVKRPEYLTFSKD